VGALLSAYNKSAMIDFLQQCGDATLKMLGWRGTLGMEGLEWVMVYRHPIFGEFVVRPQIAEPSFPGA
jgi:hypothetical protein